MVVAKGKKKRKAKVLEFAMPACEICGRTLPGVYHPDKLRFCNGEHALRWYRKNDKKKIVRKE